MAAFRWARDSMAADILGSLVQSRTAPGGTVPARLSTIVHLAYYTLWEAHDWRFKHFRATLTFAADTDTKDLPSNFDKLDMKWLKENNRRGIVQFTEDTQGFEAQRQLPNETPGQPWIVRIEPKDGNATFLWQARCIPPANKEYSYPYIYLRNTPVLAASSASPVWPNKFDRGWKLLAEANAFRAFVRDKSWIRLMDMYKEWLNEAKSKDDETMVSNTVDIGDTQGDVGSLPSQYSGLQSGGYVVVG